MTDTVEEKQKYKSETKQPKTAMGYLLQNIDSFDPPPDANDVIKIGKTTELKQKQVNDENEVDFLDGEVLLDPNDIKPWKYANRSDLDLGDIDSLILSIKETGQLEPILVRQIMNGVKGSAKYEFIFGRRRWTACKRAGLKIKAKVESSSDREALKKQKYENEERQSISAYSEGMHYKRLLDENEFNSQQELSDYLSVDRRRLSDLLSYSRIPDEVQEKINNINELPVAIAAKVASYAAKGEEYVQALLKIAPTLGIAMSKRKLDIAIAKHVDTPQSKKMEAIKIKSKFGAELFSVRSDSNGAPCITLHRAAREVIDQEELIEYVKNFIDSRIEKETTKN